MISEVVFPVDFSEGCVEACPYIAALTERLRARLTLLHVLELDPRGSSPLDRLHSGDSEDREHQRNDAYEALRAFRHHYLPHIHTADCVLEGDAATCIVVYGGESKERMIVMPTHGLGPFRQMLLGSVTAKVLHDAHCPVITAPHLEKAVDPKRSFDIKRILCAISLDWETDQVLRRAAEVARQLRAQLEAIHIITPVEEGLLPLVDPGCPPISTESARTAVEEALNRAGVSAPVHVAVGEVSRRVSQCAAELHADLIAIGRGGAPELPGRLGSHGYAIVRRARCPVLCV